MKQGKARITYTIKKNYESHLHSAGVNCLALDTRRGGRLYTGSRDSTINAYHLGWDEHLLNNNTTPSEESLCEISDGPSVFESKAKDNPEVLDAIHAHNTGLIPHLPQPQFKESLLNHSDWVNDMVLFNDGDNLLSASSDRTILLWSTKHGENNLAPGIVGQHHDYVKRIQYSKDRNWVTSGGLDEKIHIWDLSQSGKTALTSILYLN